MPRPNADATPKELARHQREANNALLTGDYNALQRASANVNRIACCLLRMQAAQARQKADAERELARILAAEAAPDAENGATE